MIIRTNRTANAPAKKEVAPEVTKVVEEKKHYPKRKEYKQVVKPVEDIDFSVEE